MMHLHRLLLPIALAWLPFVSSAQDRVTNVKVGDMAPEITMTSPDGEVLKLTQLKGKVVLLDFWASWCRPCRLDNPHVRHVYHTFKDKLFTNGDGFAVFSVSLDRQGGMDAWKGAIAKDSLDWKWHVGAVGDGNNTAANTYGVRFIPTNVVIDGTGRIIAMDLHGPALDQLLEGLLEKDPAKLKAQAPGTTASSKAEKAREKAEAKARKRAERQAGK
jgi:peroxiredoxin